MFVLDELEWGWPFGSASFVFFWLLLFLLPKAVRKVLARLKYSVPLYKAGIGFSILTEECLTFRTVFPPHFCLALTFVFHPHLPLGRLLFSFHICLSDDFWFAPTFASFPTTFVSLHSSAETSFLLDFYIRFPPIFAFHQSSFSTNLRLRIFHTLVPHNLVYPELFFVPMSISTVEQIPTQSAILQSVTHIIRQTERCSSPCFFMGVSIIECRLNPT